MTAATCLTHTTITEPVAGERPDYSIRSLMMTSIREAAAAQDGTAKGKARAEQLKQECQELVEELHPTSAAAKKFGKHYAWYKATMKKAGEQV